MPQFELVPMEEALRKSANTRRVIVLAPYLECIEQLTEGQAGKLQPSEDERVTTVRRRLGAAAKLAGKDLTTRRVGDVVYFWRELAKRGRSRRRGRPPKEQSSEA